MKIEFEKIKVVGFDADDTLWINENYYREHEHKWATLLEEYLPIEKSIQKLYTTELKNLELFGYGIKSFMLSMIETAIEISSEQVSSRQVLEIIGFGKQMLKKDVEFLEGVEDVLQKLYGKFKLILITKGDLLDQERKLSKSGLKKFFHHIEIVSNKHENNYMHLLNHLAIKHNEFLMVGNSLKSDIIPALNIGCNAVYIPYETTWVHEYIENPDIDNSRFLEISSLSELPALLLYNLGSS